MGKIIAYCKIRCHHSEASAELLGSLKTIKSTVDTSKSIEIIWLKSEDFNVRFKLNGQNEQMSKDKFFTEHFDKKHNVNIGTHRTFPVILYESSNNNQRYYIGGNSDLQEVFNNARSIPDVSELNPHQMCVQKFTGFETEGKKRLFCHILRLLGKIST